MQVLLSCKTAWAGNGLTRVEWITAISQTLKISLNIWWKRETVCALPQRKVKPFHSWLLFGLPNVSPFSCLGDFFAHLSSQVFLPLHLFPLPPLFAEWWHKHRPSFRGHRWLYDGSDGKLSCKNFHFSEYIYMRIKESTEWLLIRAHYFLNLMRVDFICFRMKRRLSILEENISSEGNQEDSPVLHSWHSLLWANSK